MGSCSPFVWGNINYLFGNPSNRAVESLLLDNFSYPARFGLLIEAGKFFRPKQTPHLSVRGKQQSLLLRTSEILRSFFKFFIQLRIFFLEPTVWVAWELEHSSSS
jgi:hypothetical protein